MVVEQPIEPFVAPLPWLSVPDAEFPPRAPRQKRRILRSKLLHEPLYFPPESAPVKAEPEPTDLQVPASDIVEQQDVLASKPVATPTTIPSDTQSDHMSTQPTTPSSAVTASVGKIQHTPTQAKPTRIAMPVLPIIPVIPSSPTAARKSHRDSIASTLSKPDLETTATVQEAAMEDSTPAVSAPPPAPKSWADLVKKQAAANAAASAIAPIPIINGISAPKTESLGEVLGEINVVESPSKVAFLKPRGLVNTGNMCYMNSVSQNAILVYLFSLTSSGSSNACFLHTFLRFLGQSGSEGRSCFQEHYSSSGCNVSLIL